MREWRKDPDNLVDTFCQPHIDNKKKAEYYPSQLEYTWNCTWHWDENIPGKHTIRVVAHNRTFNVSSAELSVICLP
ncbi:MAG TPA: hypothetical protein ENG66_04365 [Thermococcus sp.]|nr:hypothetical protein [Thermococcus sp.]